MLVGNEASRHGLTPGEIDRAIAHIRIQNYSGAFKNLSPELKDNKEVALAAMKNYGKALEYASHRLKDDKDVVLAAVQID